MKPIFFYPSCVLVLVITFCFSFFLPKLSSTEGERLEKLIDYREKETDERFEWRDEKTLALETKLDLLIEQNFIVDRYPDFQPCGYREDKEETDEREWKTADWRTQTALANYHCGAPVMVEVVRYKLK